MSQLMLVNPRKRRRKKTTSRKRRRKNPAPAKRSYKRRKTRALATTKRRRKRNPAVRGKKMLVNTVTDSGVGAVGAIATDIAFAYLPVPDMFKSGNMKYLAKGGVSLLLGMVLSSKMMPTGVRRHGEAVARGGLTVALYESGKTFAKQVLPEEVGNKLGEYVGPTPYGGFGYLNPGMNTGEEIDGFGEYVTGQNDFDFAEEVETDVYDWNG